MKIWLIIVVLHATKVVVKKKLRPEPGIQTQVVCMVFQIFTWIEYLPYPTLPWVPEVFFLVEGDRIERRSQVAKRRQKNITNSQNDQLLDGLIAQLVEDCIGIAQVKL